MRNKTWIALVLVTFVTAFCCTGCHSLRKKFIRKKKANAEDKFIPILEPVEYEATRVTQADRYSHHYQTYRVWERELMSGLDRRETDKRLEFSLDQLLVNLESMAKWAPEDKKQSVEDALADYRQARGYFESPKAFRNKTSFVSKLKRYERSVRNSLKPEMVFPKE